MKQPCSVPFLPPRLVTCGSGHIQLQVGPAFVRLSVAELRVLCERAREAVERLPDPAEIAPTPPESVN